MCEHVDIFKVTLPGFVGDPTPRLPEFNQTLAVVFCKACKHTWKALGNYQEPSRKLVESELDRMGIR